MSIIRLDQFIGYHLDTPEEVAVFFNNVNGTIYYQSVSERTSYEEYDPERVNNSPLDEVFNANGSLIYTIVKTRTAPFAAITATNPVEPTPPQCDLTLNGTVTDETAEGANNGKATLQATSSWPITYYLDGVEQASNLIENLAPGSYVASATDTNGCSKTFPFTIEAYEDPFGRFGSLPQVEMSQDSISRWNAAFNPVVLSFDKTHDSLKPNFRVEIEITTDKGVITGSWSPSPEGETRCDIGAYLRSLVNAKDTFKYDVINWVDPNRFAPFSFKYREVWDGGSSEVITPPATPPVNPPTGGGNPPTTPPIAGVKRVSSIIGYANENGTTTGGQGGPILPVTTIEQLRNAGQNQNDARLIVVRNTVQGTGDEIIWFGSNKTVVCLPGVEILGACLKVGSAGTDPHSNVIFRNIKSRNVRTNTNYLIRDGAHHVWIDHCEGSADREHGWDGYYDGLLDVGRGADYVTCTFNRLHDSNIPMQMGFDNSHTEDIGKIKVTLAYNWYHDVSERQPSGRYGRFHCFNNYHHNCGYSIASAMDAQFRLDNNHFDLVTIPVRTDINGVPGLVSGMETNKFTNCGESHILDEHKNLWLPPYLYADDYLMSKDDVEAFVKANAGATLTEAQLFDYTMPSPAGRLDSSSMMMIAAEEIEVPAKFYVVYAAKQLGDQYGGNMAEHVTFSDEPSYPAKFMTRFDEPTAWDGLPFDVSYIRSEYLEAKTVKLRTTSLDINKKPTGVAKPAYMLAGDGDRILIDEVDKIIVGPGELAPMVNTELPGGTGVNRMMLAGSPSPLTRYFQIQLYTGTDATPNFITEPLVVEVVKPCHDPYIYLKWINTLGGWDYWRFGHDQVEQLTTANGISIDRVVFDWENDDTIADTISKNAVKKINLGVIVADNKVNGLKGLHTSVKIQMLVGLNPYKWQTVELNVGTFQIRRAKANHSEFKFTISLPEINIQTQ